VETPRQRSATLVPGEGAWAKQIWETPQLTTHGTVGTITAGGGGQAPDTGGGNSALTDCCE